MNESFPAENKIREYLLGRLDSQPEKEDQLSRQILFDDELSEIVDSVEDEIIEDYLDGSLDEADRKAVEEYFLRAPERKEKLWFARLLRDRFAKRNKVGTATGEPASDDESRRVLVLRQRIRYSIYIGLAAAVLLVVSCAIYQVGVRRGVQSQTEAGRKSQTQLENELAQERQRSSDVAKRLEKYEPPAVSLLFVGIFCDTDQQGIEIKPFTQRINVEIQMPGASGRTYDVRLQTRSGKEIWTQAGVKAGSDSLVFEMPARSITSGPYCVVVNSQAKQYCFQAKVEK